MIFGKAITFEADDLRGAAAKAGAVASAEDPFLARLRAGDADAFDNLVMRHASEVYGFLITLTRNSDDAAELTQETFLSALKGVKGFRGDCELRTWLFRIAVNHSRNRFRWWKRRRRDATVSIDEEREEDSRPIAETLAGSLPSPEDDVLSDERRRLLTQALNSLPGIYREAVVLCDVQGLTYEEVAASLELNIGTVKSRIARGREELRRRMTDF